MAHQSSYEPAIVRPGDWSDSSWNGFLATGGVLAFLSAIAAIICLMVAIIHTGPNDDKGAISSLRVAWTLVSQDSAAHYDGSFPPFDEMKKVIENGSDKLNFSGFTASYGVGPVGVHDTDGSTVLIDQHSSPKLLEMFIHSSGTGRDIELTARPGRDPKIFYPAGVVPPKPNKHHHSHHNNWGPLEWLGIVDAAILGMFLAICAFFSLAGNFLLWRHRNPDTLALRRIYAIYQAFREERLARARRKEDAALAQERWQALVGHGVYGPLKQSAGYEILVADKTENIDGVQFRLDCYRWSAHLKDWVNVSADVELPRLSTDIQMIWKRDSDIDKIAEAWFDLGNTVDRMNRARWASIDPEAATRAIGVQSITAALPSPNQMIEGAPAGIDALRAKQR